MHAPCQDLLQSRFIFLGELPYRLHSSSLHLYFHRPETFICSTAGILKDLGPIQIVAQRLHPSLRLILSGLILLNAQRRVASAMHPQVLSKAQRPAKTGQNRLYVGMTGTL